MNRTSRLAPMFHLEVIPAPGEAARLPQQEARHLSASRRLREGDAVDLFDARGTVAHAAVLACERTGPVRVQILERHRTAPEALQLHLASAVPKGDRQSVLLDMATQLGMSAYTPLLCARSATRPSPAAARRWQRIVLEACKQSRRLYAPTLRPPADPSTVARRAVAAGDAVWVADPAAPLFNPRATPVAARTATLMIGPEGGFTGAERDALAAAGAVSVGLGETILRVELAAVTALNVYRLASLPLSAAAAGEGGGSPSR